MVKKLTIKNAKEVFDNILNLEDEITKKNILKEINEVLDNLKEADEFGTEGQLDPRGDNRT